MRQYPEIDYFFRDKIEAKAQEDMATLAISFSQEKDELKAEFKKVATRLYP